MKEIEAISENLRLVVTLDTEPLSRIKAAEPSLQKAQACFIIVGLHTQSLACR